MSAVTVTAQRPLEGVVLRATWTAVEVTGVSAIAHHAAGGVLPSAMFLAAAGVPVLAASLLFLHCRIGFTGGLVVALAGQAAMHVLLAGHTGHAGHTEGSPVLMTLAHAAGAAWMLLAWALRRRAWQAVRAALAEPYAVPPRRRVAVRQRDALLSPPSWLLSRSQRGPPGFVCG